MKKDNIPVKQHILPKVYLNKFVNSSKKIGIIKIAINRDKIRWSHSSGMGYQENYFDLEPLKIYPVFESINPLIIESQINKKFEDSLTQYWDKLKLGVNELTINDKYEILSIIYNFKLRTRFFRDFYFSADFSKLLVQESIDNLLPSLWSEKRDSYLQFGIDFQEYSYLMSNMINKNYIEKDCHTLHNNFLYSTFKEKDSKVKKETLWKLVQSRWTILHAESRIITTDNPGVSENNKKIYNFLGEIDDKFDLYFPISCNSVLKIEYRKNIVDNKSLIQLSHQSLSMNESNYVNLLSAINGMHEIYGSDMDVLKSAKKSLLDKTKFTRELTPVTELFNMNYSKNQNIKSIK